MNNKPYIIKDSREQLGWEFEESEHWIGTKVAKLDTGDYAVEGLEHRFAIERKGGVAEWAANVTQDRFVSELERLAYIDHPYILLEFSLRDLLNYPVGSGIPKSQQPFIKLKGSFLLSKTLGFSLEYNVHILFCDNSTMAQQVAKSLFKRIIHAYRPSD